MKHPADEIARALARANGILTVIGGCYDKSNGEFAIGTAYIAESIAAVDLLLNSATQALGRLYESCDLSIIRDLREAVEPAVEAEPVAVAVEPQPAAPQPAAAPMFARQGLVAKPQKGGYLAAFGPTDPAPSLTQRVETAIPSAAKAQPMPTKRETILDQPASTYEELLAKVTAVADQAAFQAHSSPGDRSLLPVLEGLRTDLLKMSKVA